ncbi:MULTISPECIES: amino acid--tRNA ligase-related protein [unclassified Bradyrhizobium]|uniref:amino acid--tRNA ligase-related protein n=1 Tax=unclassified Bradyrhizobium TaxID=2631580 RepID=UPI002916080B|nr:MULTISPECIES: amino acid--tRNA ligase-related protein [unclassified Bradyrhizobium]
MIQLQDTFNCATVEFMNAAGLRANYLPVTTHSVSSPSAPGSDSLPVQVNLYGIPTYLADSMQFLLEYTCRFHPGGVYYVQPSFRGESPDQRHLSQFFHAEAEIAGTLDDVMSLIERYVRHLAAAFLARADRRLLKHPGKLEAVCGEVAGFDRITLEEATKCLAGSSGAVKRSKYGVTITAAGERELLHRRDGKPVWLVAQDARMVPFYQARCETMPSRTKTADLLMGIGETVGAGERHHSAEDLRAAMREQGVGEERYGWYIDMKADYPLRTSGFGMGVERFLMWITGGDDIRDYEIVARANGRYLVP